MELTEAIRKAIDWEALPKISSTDLFQEIKAFLVAEKDAGRVLSSRDELYRKFLSQRKKDDVWAQFEICIDTDGNARTATKAERGQPGPLTAGALDAYASALVNAVKDEPDGFGNIQEERYAREPFTYLPINACSNSSRSGCC